MTNQKYYESASFLILQQRWYDKLAKKGFVDIEQGKNKDRVSRWGKLVDLTHCVSEYSDEYEYAMRFYDIATDIYWHFVNDYDELEKEILFDYCQGKSLRQTAERLDTTVWKCWVIVNPFKNKVLKVMGLEPVCGSKRKPNRKKTRRKAK